MLYKKCRICKEVKELTEFHKKKDAPGGVRNECKDCVKDIQKKYKEAIEICDITIDEINDNNFNANVSEFTKRLERLEKKFEKNKQ